MADTMVTGRMAPAKKAAGNKVLKSLGLSASEAVNKLYDHLIEYGQLPFPSQAEKPITLEDRKEAACFVRGLPKKNRFSSMTDAEIKRTKLDGLSR